MFEPITYSLCGLLLCLTSILVWISPQWILIPNTRGLVRIGMLSATFLLTVLLGNRWSLAGHIPMSNLYESLLFLVWSLCLLSLLLLGQAGGSSLPCLGSSTACLLYLFTTCALPSSMQRSAGLVPALQANWLVMHVTMMVLSYGCLVTGSLLATGAYVLTPTSGYLKNQQWTASEGINSRYWSWLQNRCLVRRRASTTSELDSWSLGSIGLGFVFLTIGLLAGAVWANETWGSYWNWDPKETWALITWIVFAIYLHSRVYQQSQRSVSTWIALGGLALLWFSYLGVNLLGEGLHSYGWWNRR